MQKNKPKTQLKSKKSPNTKLKTTPRKPKKRPAQSVLPKPLGLEECYKVCSLDQLKISTTKTREETHDIISQDRAVRAINLGLSIRKPGYNIYVAGIPGTGKTSVIKTFLEKWSLDAPIPQDWVYVYDFETPEAPRAISLNPGEGRKLKKRMEGFVKILKTEIPSALQSEDYENAVNAYLSASNDRKTKLFNDLEKKARNLDFQIKSTRMGIETIPVVDGRPLSEKDYLKLNDVQREHIEEQRSEIEPEVLDFARRVRAIELETREYVEKLRSELGRQVTSQHLDSVIEENKENPEVVKYLEQVRSDILENLLDFVEQEDTPPNEQPPVQQSEYDWNEERDKFRKYAINVFVDQTHAKGAPVIIESNPTYYNLFGKIEKNVEHGMYLTDFTLIKAGAIHKASGGYLVINATDVFKTGPIWETLKRVLKNRLGFIEDMGEQYSLLPTSGLRPTPIPLDVKVILIGSDEIYRVLFDIDEEFQKIFKIKAEFDYKTERSKPNIDSYVDFVATRVGVENLLQFDKSGVSSIIEYSSRLVEDQRHLSTQFGELKDVIIEADFVAREKGSKIVKREHVDEALDQKFYRVNLYEEHLLESVSNKDIILDFSGAKIGQVNGLAVYDFGDYSFGKVSRVTCTVSASSDGIFNLERAAKLSGKIHDKGMYILNAFLNALLARERGLGISASVCFEQSYGIIDGDSATITEAVAILSAMAKIPIKQNLAMTGSLSQFGEVQPIGGVNEKIEGFFRTVQKVGNENEYSVLIPHQNTENLMLHRTVQDAIRSGYLKIYPVATFAQVFELATGVPFGAETIYDEDFIPDSALDIIRHRLENMHQRRRELNRADNHHVMAKKN